MLNDNEKIENVREITDNYTTTTTIYFNKVVFPSIPELTSPMAFPQHFPPP